MKKFNALYEQLTKLTVASSFFFFLISFLIPNALTSQSNTKTFEYTGAIEAWTVPNGVTSIEIIAIGADGGDSQNREGQGGSGARATATFSVTPGEVLEIAVGAAGDEPLRVGTGGGGGGSGVRKQGANAPLIVAGGGGGGGLSNSQGGGGAVAEGTGNGGNDYSPNGSGGGGGFLTDGDASTGNGGNGGKGGFGVAGGTGFSNLGNGGFGVCLLYTSPSPRDQRGSRMPSSA